MSVENVLIVGAAVFVVSSLYFLFQNKKGLNSPLLVSLTTLTSYLVMLEGRFLIGAEADAAHWTRWAFYGLSCALLAYEISKQLGFDVPKTTKNMFLTVLVMVTGVLSSISVDEFKWMLFGVSCAAFLIILYDIFTSKSKNLKTISPFVIAGWCVFPIIFLLSNEGLGVITGFAAVAAYLVLDIFTKIGFYFALPSKSGK
jgi:bacteriorhodopsin